MKTKIVTLLPLLLFPFTLSSCEKEKATLTYGTFIKSDINSLKEITTSELANKAFNEKETFLLAVYQGDYSNECYCWNTFKNIIVDYTNTSHEIVYLYNAQEQDDSIKDLRIEKRKDSTPLLYIFDGEKIIQKFSYLNNKDKQIFENTSTEPMFNKIHKYVTRPVMVYIDESFGQSTTGVYLYFRSGCGDCKYALPNVVLPYIKNHKINSRLYLFDLQSQYELSKNELAPIGQRNHYQELKNKYGLSQNGNAEFGYQEGVVPTIQYINLGKIKDACVYFNDIVSKKENGSFYISDSYYSDERMQSLEFFKNTPKITKVLKGMTIEKGVLETPNGDYYWSQEEASKYHTPILEAFLDYYLK